LPIDILAAEVQAPSPRLSAVLDRSLFIAPPVHAREDSSVPAISMSEKSFDELTASPFHVEPYPPRKTNAPDAPILDTPSQRRVEGVYDRFLMATSGVKRLGKGYQSDNLGPVGNIHTPNVSNYKHNQNHRAFYSTRRAMPPPVSSDDQRRTVSVDELGVVTCTAGAGSPVLKDESNTTVALVRRALKAIVPGKTVSRRLSRMA
jgi:serine/threonine-protein kinase GIN4